MVYYQSFVIGGYMRYTIYCALWVYIFSFVACSSLHVQPRNIMGYDNGIAILQSEKPNSKAQVEVAQERIGGSNYTPLLLYIVVENLNDNNILFSMKNITIHINNKIITPTPFESLSHTNINLTESLYDYGIEIKPSEKFAKDSFFNINTYRPLLYPIIIDNVLTFRYRFYNNSLSRANMYATYQADNKARKLLIAHYLRKNTLTQNNAKGGFILIPYQKLESGNLNLKIDIEKDQHEFKINLTKP